MPDAERAVIAKEKITEYLLNPDNPRNGGKAAFFAGFGFALPLWEEFAAALHQIAIANDVRETRTESFGTKYIVVGRLASPDGRNPLVKTIWQIDNDGTVPRLISAYPA